MGLFRRSKEHKLVPDNFPAEVCAIFGLPHDAKFMNNEQPQWITEEEAARQREEWERNRPSFEELMQDPNVRAVVEAFTMEDVSLKTRGSA